MNVLFIAQGFPYPPDTGSRNHVFHWLDAVSRVHDVHLLWIGDPAQGKERITELPGVRINCIRAAPGMGMSARIRRLAKAAAVGIPPTSLVWMTRETCREILQHIRNGNYDVIILAENVVAGYAPVLSTFAPVVLLKPSVQAVDAREARRRCGMWHPRGMLEQWMAGRFEKRSCRAATAVCVVNTEDVANLAQRYHLGRSAQVVPIGVDLAQFPKRERDPSGQVVSFFGNLTWGANIDAVRWYAKEIIPKVDRVYPGATFRVIGSAGEDLRKDLSSPHVEFTGRVVSIPETMADATVGVVPVVSGTGVRFKLLEMLSLGVPVVTTSLGALGTGCVHDQHALIADDADSFAAAVVRLLGDVDLRKRMAEAGRELIRRHSWENLYPRIVEVIEKAATVHEHCQVSTPTRSRDQLG
jgi:polysaccharide biosynthesis protein PslH